MSELDDQTEKGQPVSDSDIRRIDTQYESFKPFSDWKDTYLDTERWERYGQIVENLKATDQTELERAQHIARRAAAIETGAIEGLYETDRGFTYTVAAQVASWDALMSSKGVEIRSLLEGQLSAYEGLLDLVTSNEPLTQYTIRSLHKEICQGQDEYLVHTQLGPQRQELKKGEYKQHPNHVRLQTGAWHAYAPVDLVAAEVQRLCDETNTEDYSGAHPILQAAYVHHALTAIHPFADGNGRVARALASMYTYRSHSVPILISADIKSEYFSALERADQEEYEPFVNLILECTADAIQLVSESVQTARRPDPDVAVARLRRLYRTSGGYTHAEVDEAGYELFNLVSQEFSNEASRVTTSSDEITVSIGAVVIAGGVVPGEGPLRVPVISGTRNVDVQVLSQPPAQASTGTALYLHVPKDAGEYDNLVVGAHGIGEEFHARIDEVVPTVRITTQMRAKMFAERVFGILLGGLTEQAQQRLREVGYS
jgi:Fic family protein